MVEPRHRQRPAARAAAALASVVLVLGVLGPLGTAVAAERAGDEKTAEASTAKQKRPTLAQLRRRAERVATDLERRTAELETSRARLAEADRVRDELARAAVAARTVADRAHDDLGRYAAAAYRGQQMPLDITVLVAPQGESDDTLHALATLLHTGGVKVDVATFAADAAAQADDLEAQAAEAASAAAVAEYTVQMQVADLKALARETRRELRAEVARLERVAARRLAADCRDRVALSAKFPNGLIPAELLCDVGVGEHRLRGDAAVAFKELAAVYEKAFDAPICLTDSYRSLAGQHAVFEQKPDLAAVPGRSQHGLGLAVDLCGGIQTFGSEQHRWMREHAPTFGWLHPTWAQQGGSRPEAWHWEYDDVAYQDARKERRRLERVGSTRRGKASTRP